SIRNIPHCTVTEVSALNPVSLVGHDKVVMTSLAVEEVQEWLS
ncbi:MAG TPA: 50S ribosomal protein L4, partial [Leucothrix sp.]|nr:50S ribosomal protein L4 [Leucothrix sp.]